MVGADEKAPRVEDGERHPVDVVGAPYGGVKEQGPCVYANGLAARGFAALTFDLCYMGESAGYSRRVSSPDLFTEDFSACVDYLGLQPRLKRFEENHLYRHPRGCSCQRFRRGRTPLL